MRHPSSIPFEAQYRLGERLGEGGFGTVFRAEKLDTGDVVAVKMLEFDQVDGYAPNTEARIEREITILRQLRCPSTIRLLDDGALSDGRRYLAFEYVDGEDLAERLDRDGRVGQDEALSILRQVLEALAEAHGLGLLHRDIKPANIRLARSTGAPRVKLLDFGLARSMEASAQVTRIGEMVGTPRYMSPEQLLALELTPASDVYSLGMVMIEMMLGPSFFKGEKWSDQFDRMKESHEYELPTNVWSQGLVELLLRMTARHVEDRFSDAKSVLAAMDELRGSPTLAIDPTMRLAPDMTIELYERHLILVTDHEVEVDPPTAIGRPIDERTTNEMKLLKRAKKAEQEALAFDEAPTRAVPNLAERLKRDAVDTPVGTTLRRDDSPRRADEPNVVTILIVAAVVVVLGVVVVGVFWL